MNKEQRARKRRFRLDYESFHRKNESYPTYLERELERFQERVGQLNRMVWARDSRFECFGQYVEDMEKGLRVVEKSVVTLPSEKDAEVVYATVCWLKGIVRDARERFRNGVSEEA